MRLIDADELLDILPTEETNARMAVLLAPTVDTSKELICSVTVNMDTDEVIERLKERGWGPVKHGRWMYIGDETIEDGGYCSVCNQQQPAFWWFKAWRYAETPYCPNCGAKMDEEGV